MLNGIYYESGTGDCYKSSSASECNFNLEIELPKGLDETARNMIDKEVIWKIGGSKTTDEEVTVKMFYERERGISTYNNYPVEWSDTTDVGDRYNGIALIYPSDYGYATNGGSIGREKCFAEYLYNWDSEDGNYQSECGGTDWLKPNSGCLWTLSPYSLYSSSIFNVSSSGYVNGNANNNAYRVWPTLYLTTSTKIVGGTGDINSPFVLSIQ